MTLLDELAVAEVRKPGPKCRIGTIIASLDEPERSDVQAAIFSTHYASTIARVLKAHGYDVTPHGVQRHKRGDCQCPSPTS